jgi:hypothetical protein
MLGAIEVKAISKIAARHGAWKPVHSAVLGCLLAHRNRRSSLCCPSRQTIAAFAGVSERTVDRVLSQLRGWQAISAETGRSLNQQTYAATQYSFLFELPAENSPAENPVIENEVVRNFAQEPCAKIDESRAPKSGEPCAKIGVAVRQNEGCNKEEGKVPSKNLREGLSEPPPIKSKFNQWDFDERDTRKLHAALESLHRATEGMWIVDADPPPEGAISRMQIFAEGCRRAGITVQRGLELSAPNVADGDDDGNWDWRTAHAIDPRGQDAKDRENIIAHGKATGKNPRDIVDELQGNKLGLAFKREMKLAAQKKWPVSSSPPEWAREGMA